MKNKMEYIEDVFIDRDMTIQLLMPHGSLIIKQLIPEAGEDKWLVHQICSEGSRYIIKRLFDRVKD